MTTKLLKQCAMMLAPLGLILATVGVSGIGAAPAYAQTSTFPDVPANHWAYQAVQDLADKGYVKGYPNGQFLGKRALTRYEFATVIDRIAQTISDLSAASKSGQLVTTPTGSPVTQDDLNTVQALVDSFKTQLAAIQSVTAGAQSPFQDQIDGLRQDVHDAKALANKAQATADNSYGVGANRKFSISGYIQTRFVGGPKAKTLYPNGTAAVAGAYNGNYAQGGAPAGFQVRRARIKFAGQVTDNTKYNAQLDFSGSVASSTTQVTVREANVVYTFGDGTAKYPMLTAGQFATPFGYALPASSASLLTPERPLAFNEGSFGIMNSEDYDKGVCASWLLPIQVAPLKVTAALVNGTGRTSEEIDRNFNQIYRLSYQSPNKMISVGGSYWTGQIGVPGTGAIAGLASTSTLSSSAATTAYNAAEPQRRLWGADAQLVCPYGPFLNAEYISGRYDQRTFLDPAITGVTYPTAVTEYVPGNHINGYYVQGGWTLYNKTTRPLSVFANYDVLDRGASGFDSSSAWDDKNFGYGIMYNLDSATRLRLYFDRPSQVAHIPGTASPQNIGLTTAEIQVKF